MKTIKKYPLTIEPRQTIEIPFQAELLAVHVSENVPAIKVLVDSANSRMMARTFLIVSEEKELPANLNATKYIGSFVFLDSAKGLVSLFVFEE